MAQLQELENGVIGGVMGGLPGAVLGFAIGIAPSGAKVYARNNLYIYHKKGE